MKVKELIEKLQKCNPDAEAVMEILYDEEIHEVAEYHIEGCSDLVYIGDTLEQIDEAVAEEYGWTKEIK